MQFMPFPFSFLCEVVRVLSEAGLRMDTSRRLYFTKWNIPKCSPENSNFPTGLKIQQNDFILAKVPKHGNFPKEAEQIHVQQM